MEEVRANNNNTATNNDYNINNKSSVGIRRQRTQNCFSEIMNMAEELAPVHQYHQSLQQQRPSEAGAAAYEPSLARFSSVSVYNEKSIRYAGTKCIK